MKYITVHRESCELLIIQLVHVNIQMESTIGNAVFYRRHAVGKQVPNKAVNSL